MSVRTLRRQRRFSLGESVAPSIGAFEDFESSTLGNFGGAETGWIGAGKVFTYNSLIAFEDFENSSTSSLVYPVFGWAGAAGLTGPSITTQPATIGSILGATVSFTVVTLNGLTPLSYQWLKNGVAMSNGGVVSGATTATLTLTGLTSSEMGATFSVVITDANGRSVTSAGALLTDYITSWVSRVVANGGASPSADTVTALSTFLNGVNADGILPLIKGMCCFVPDSLIASITPLIQGTGNDPWTNANFVASDLNINGLKGNGSNKYLNTGLKPNAIFSGVTSGGLTLYVTEGNNVGQVDIGVEGSAYNINSFKMYVDWSDAITYFDCFGSAGGRVQGGNSAWAGYISGNRTSSSAIAIYKATSAVAHTTVASAAGASDQSLDPKAILVFADNSGAGPVTPNGYSSKRMSFAAVHEGLTSGQSSNFFNRVHQMRKDLHGGYITISGPDIANDWAARVVTNGGAAPSAGTVSALRTFLSGLITDGIDTKMLAVNCFAPDNLTACLTPLIVGNGLGLWTNTGFVGGDLTVNGLTGNGSSKYLATGIVASALGANLGMASYAYAAPAVGMDMGSFDTKDFYLAAKYSNGKYHLVNGVPRATLFIIDTSPGAGFYTSQRTGVTTNKGYFANSGSAFAQIGATDTTSSTGYPAMPLYSMALQQSVGGPSLHSGSTISFQAITTGLNSTEAGNLYARVQTLRTSLGGGYV